jgi:hypothetical protein
MYQKGIQVLENDHIEYVNAKNTGKADMIVR